MMMMRIDDCYKLYLHDADDEMIIMMMIHSNQ